MLLLAVLNPDATGVTSDDGFVIGQFTLSGSLNLMFVAGTFQAGPRALRPTPLLRGLRVGPEWFRLAVALARCRASWSVRSSSHSEGVDFRVLEPLWLAVGLFVPLPTIFVALLSTVSERLLARDQVPTPVVVVGLALVAGGLRAAAAAGRDGRGTGGTPAAGRTADRAPGAGLAGRPWLLRAALAVVFVLALADLVNELQPWPDRARHDA